MISIAKLPSPVEASGLPSAESWNVAKPIKFCADWRGRNADPQRQTEVRGLWSHDALFLQFQAHYVEIYTYADGPMRRDKLWDRDVVETFLQPPHQSGRTYTEIEIGPNGDWIDLAIQNGQLADLQCALKPRVTVDEKAKVWTAEVAIQMKCLTAKFDPTESWRGNFFRIEGPERHRFYSSWQATNTPQPNFHVPEAFATIRFTE